MLRIVSKGDKLGTLISFKSSVSLVSNFLVVFRSFFKTFFTISEYVPCKVRDILTLLLRNSSGEQKCNL